jgi:hypothetical protein
VNGYAPVGVRLGRCGCRACRDAAQAAVDRQRTRYLLRQPRRSRDPKVRAAAIWAEEFDSLQEASS